MLHFFKLLNFFYLTTSYLHFNCWKLIKIPVKNQVFNILAAEHDAPHYFDGFCSLSLLPPTLKFLQTLWTSCNEWRGSSPRPNAWATQLPSNDRESLATLCPVRLARKSNSYPRASDLKSGRSIKLRYQESIANTCSTLTRMKAFHHSCSINQIAFTQMASHISMQILEAQPYLAIHYYVTET